MEFGERERIEEGRSGERSGEWMEWRVENGEWRIETGEWRSKA